MAAKRSVPVANLRGISADAPSLADSLSLVSIDQRRGGEYAEPLMNTLFMSVLLAEIASRSWLMNRGIAISYLGGTLVKVM